MGRRHRLQTEPLTAGLTGGGGDGLKFRTRVTHSHCGRRLRIPPPPPGHFCDRDSTPRNALAAAGAARGARPPGAVFTAIPCFGRGEGGTEGLSGLQGLRRVRWAPSSNPDLKVHVRPSPQQGPQRFPRQGRATVAARLGGSTARHRTARGPRRAFRLPQGLRVGVSGADAQSAHLGLRASGTRGRPAPPGQRSCVPRPPTRRGIKWEL